MTMSFLNYSCFIFVSDNHITVSIVAGVVVFHISANEGKHEVADTVFSQNAIIKRKINY